MSTNTQVSTNKPKFKSRIEDIPPEFVVESHGQPLIRFGGYMALLDKMGMYRIQTACVKSTPEETVYECKAWLIPFDAYLSTVGITKENPCLSLLLEPVIMHGTASVKNLAPNMLKFRETMAETRSIVRALRMLSGCSYTAVDELDRSDLEKIGNVPGMDISVQTLEEMVAASKETAASMPALPSSRKESITYLKEAKRDNKGVTEVINSHLDCNNAALLENLSDASLQELYGKVYKLIKG